MQELGFKRVVLSRELSLQEIEYICKNSNIEIDYNYHTNIYKSILYTDYIFNISSLNDNEEKFWMRVFRKIISKLEKEAYKYAIKLKAFITFNFIHAI